MTTDENLLAILRSLAPHTRFRFINGPELTSEQYRSVWTSVREDGELVRPDNFGLLVEGLREMLSSFTQTDQNGEVFVLENVDGIITRTHIIGGPGTPLDEFSERVLASAVRLSPEQTVNLLRSWVDGAPICFTHFIVLEGVSVDEGGSDYPLAEGLKIVRLPGDGEGLKMLGAPDQLTSTPVSPYVARVLGSPALCTELVSEPVFYTREKWLSPTRDAALPAHPHPWGWRFPTEALLLACNSPVEALCEWISFPISFHAFTTGIRAPVVPPIRWLFERYGSPSGPPSTLTRDTLDQAVALGAKIGAHGLGDRAMAALGRWAKSKCSSSGSDSFIDLRIALELLYAPDGGEGQITYRLQTRCARHLEQSLKCRKALAKEVKDFYGTASTYVHGRKGKDHKSRQKHRKQLAVAQETVRRALIKIVEEDKGKDLDVDALSLG